MKQARKRLTYANVMSSLAVFLVLGGATAFAADQLGKNTVGTKQLKPNAVTAAKIKNGAVTGSKLKLSTVGKVPSAATADTAGTAAKAETATKADTANTAAVANSVANRYPVAVFTGPGTKTLLTIGPFTISGSCTIDEGGQDDAELQLSTSVDGAVMDDNSGNEWTPFNKADSPAKLMSESEPTGEIGFEAGDGEFVAVGPEGTTIAFENQSVGVNLTGHPGQCFFEFIADKVS